MKHAANGVILAAVITMSPVAQAPPPAQLVDVERIGPQVGDREAKRHGKAK